MKKAFENNLVKLVLIAVVVFGLIFGVITATQNWGKSTSTVTTESSIKKLSSLYNALQVNQLIPKKDASLLNYDDGEETAVLPDISQFPFVVNPTTDDFITIYATCEKAGAGSVSWLAEMAGEFNQAGNTVDGKPVSVGIRNIPSNIGASFIHSGKYTPDLFMPASELWGSIAISKGKNLELMEKRVSGNVSGIVLSKKKHDEMTQKLGTVDDKAMIQGILSGEVSIGYTDALATSEGLNFIVTALHVFDKDDPLGEVAILQLKKFQDNIPYVAYDAAQLKDSALNGTLHGFVSDYQTYVSAPELKSSFVFIPFGVRQDQPVYAAEGLSPFKMRIATQFVDWCQTPSSQKKAADRGYNQLEDYSIYEFPTPGGATLLQVQEAWKREKNGTRDLTAVFVADVSGSMEGSPLLKLKASLNRAATVIDANTNIGLVTFSDTVNIALPIAKFDSNQKAYFLSAVKAMRSGGATAMFDAIVVAENMLMEAQANNPNTKLMLFVLTDGETNRGYSFEQIEQITFDLKIPVYTIGYNADIDVLQQISDINEATTMNAETDNVIYKLESLFNAQM